LISVALLWFLPIKMIASNPSDLRLLAYNVAGKAWQSLGQIGAMR
jgi:hypothetical protein